MVVVVVVVVMVGGRSSCCDWLRVQKPLFGQSLRFACKVPWCFSAWWVFWGLLLFLHVCTDIAHTVLLLPVLLAYVHVCSVGLVSYTCTVYFMLEVDAADCGEKRASIYLV